MEDEKVLEDILSNENKQGKIIEKTHVKQGILTWSIKK